MTWTMCCSPSTTKSQASEDRLGLVWAIRAFQFEDPAELVKDGADRWVEENLMALNTHLLGTRGSTAYYFFCLSPSDKAVRQYDSSDTAAVSSYYQHAADGLDILKDFVVRNGLAPVEGAVDWEAWYQEFILPRIEAETGPRRGRGMVCCTRAGGAVARIYRERHVDL